MNQKIEFAAATEQECVTWLIDGYIRPVTIAELSEWGHRIQSPAYQEVHR